MGFSNELQARFIRALPRFFNSMRILTGSEYLTLVGESFKAETRFTLLNEGIQLLYFETPADKDVIWASDFVNADKSNVQYRLLEGTTWTGTVAQPVINQNRQSSITAESLLYNTATGYDDASAVEIDLVVLLGGSGTGVGFGQRGSGQSGSEFMVLARSTKYTLEITNDSGETTEVVVKSVFAEVDLTD